MAVKGDQEISFTVDERITPEFLYKYCKLDPKNKKNLQRIFDPEKGPGKRVFLAEMLTGVLFVCEMPHEDRQLIRRWAKGRKIPLKFYQTTKKEKEFGLEIIKAIG